MNSKSAVNSETYGEYDTEGELHPSGLPQRRDQARPGHPAAYRKQKLNVERRTEWLREKWTAETPKKRQAHRDTPPRRKTTSTPMHPNMHLLRQRPHRKKETAAVGPRRTQVLKRCLLLKFFLC